MSALRRLVFIGPERTDARSVKRIAALTAQGWEVLGFTFHRDRGQPDPSPAWENIPLGTTYSRRYIHRAWSVVRSFGILWKHRRRLREADCLYAINPDNALLALFGRLAARRRLPLVLEIADIQPVMTGQGMKARLLRWLERRILRRSQLLLTTSPGFLRNYFEPVQRHRGPVFLIENKVWPSAALVVARQPRTAPARPGVWTIGFFGVLRCERSMDLIYKLADALPDRLRFVLRGVPAGIDAEKFHQSVAARLNIEYGGSYKYPDDLPDMYAGVDFNWCFDYSAPGANSSWLLPNRIYEGGLFHCPALAASGTETGSWLESHGLSTSFGDDLFQELYNFFASLAIADWQNLVARCAAAPNSLFVAESDYARLSDTLASLASR